MTRSATVVVMSTALNFQSTPSRDDNVEGGPADADEPRTVGFMGFAAIGHLSGQKD
jgi:hypothetical protein